MGSGVCFVHVWWGHRHAERKNEPFQMRILPAPPVSDCSLPEHLPACSSHLSKCSPRQQRYRVRAHRLLVYTELARHSLRRCEERFLTSVPTFLETREQLQRLGAVQPGTSESSNMICSFPSASPNLCQGSGNNANNKTKLLSPSCPSTHD